VLLLPALPGSAAISSSLLPPSPTSIPVFCVFGLPRLCCLYALGRRSLVLVVCSVAAVRLVVKSVVVSSGSPLVGNNSLLYQIYFTLFFSFPCSLGDLSLEFIAGKTHTNDGSVHTYLIYNRRAGTTCAPLSCSPEPTRSSQIRTDLFSRLHFVGGRWCCWCWCWCW
jgi:hypothetical protein